MNGLSASDVDFLLEKLKVAIDQARFDCETTSAMELEDITSTIKRLREENTTQPSRPDRVGDEPAWVSRLAKGDAAMSYFVAKSIAEDVRELLIYKRAMDAMAAQMICPKMTGLELAMMQLKIEAPQ